MDQPSLFDNSATKWENAALNDRWIAEVAINRPLLQNYDYLVPDGFREQIQPGMRVRVPFGRGDKLITGYCVALRQGSANPKLKEIAELLDQEPIATAHLLQLARWISQEYLCSLGQVLESMVPAGVKNLAGTREVQFYQLAAQDCEIEQLPGRLTRQQKTVLQLLKNTEEALSVHELTELAKCGTSPIKTLLKRGLIVEHRRRVATGGASTEEMFKPSANPESIPQELSLDQKKVTREIVQTIDQRKYETFLLHGVTGSGKTEVYIQAIRHVVEMGRQAIVLVPEISLTPQTIRRFRARFSSVAVLHSHLTDSERHAQWREIQHNHVQVVVGARSAIFAPTQHLGLIVIDEEHESTFKQETSPRYLARDVARKRAELLNIPLILGSATPTLESWLAVQRGEMKRLSLQKRIADRPMPTVSILDTKDDPLIKRGHSIGRTLQHSIKRHLDQQGQIILFYNLRGFTPVIFCRHCGQKLSCPDCDTSLTWHRDLQMCLCHTCDYRVEIPEQCPSCTSSALRHLGAGTQRLEEEVRNKFPEARLQRMDSDSMRQQGSHDEALERFRAGETDILLGTQMIAKGLDFPRVTLVGVISADMLLHQPDIRSSERTFQLIAQVAGRTGRGDLEGQVLVQTMVPDEPSIQHAAKHDYLSFARHELQIRHERLAPPFVRMARIICRGESLKHLEEWAEAIGVELRKITKREKLPVTVLGPAIPPVARLRKFHRMHFRLTSAQIQPIHQLWRAFVAEYKYSSEIDVMIDVDPFDLR